MDPILIAYGLGVLCIALLSSVPFYRAWRMHRAGSEPLSDDVCVACHSVDLTKLVPAVYRCNKCGFEGGSGLVAYRRAERLARIDAMDPSARYESAIGDLRESRLALLAADGLLDNATVMSVVDVMNLDQGLDRGQTKQSVVAAAALQLRRAGNAIEQASTKLRHQVVGGPVNADLSSLEMLLDSSLFSDGLLVDLASHLRIENLKDETQRALRSVERTLRSIEASSATHVPTSGSSKSL
jgi:hypothetical protein